MDDGEPGTTRPSAMATGIVDWAARAPDREAFVDVRRALTLAELDAAAASLAARLLDAPEPAGDGVASWLPVVVDRSVSAAVALHGAIRAGRAFVPIEATTSPDLVAEVFARLGRPTRAVVADPALAALLPSGVAAIPVFGHESWAADPQPVDQGAAGLVLFTSGSTGRPKGVILPWGFLDGRPPSVLGAGPDPAVGTWREGFVQPFGFAPGIRAAAVPCVGRTLCIADPSTMSIDDLLDWLDGQRIDTVGFPPSLSAAILRVADGRPRLPSVSRLRSGAEASDWALVAPLRRLVGPHVTIQADYAASEVGRIAHFEIGPDHPVGEGRIPLGRLDTGVQVRLEPVADDAATELVVARPRALGYLGDPDLTAQRFVTDGAGVRWWKSGDVVRVDADGVYRHLGRVDEMVKVRGMFVAPSRVEHTLRGLPGIGAAVVVPHTTAAGSVVLVAHVAVDDEALTAEAVQAHLVERLPQLLVPAVVVRHDDLPRTDRQKLDRRALERTDLVRWRDQPARAPGSPLEAWCLAEVRRIVGVDDVAPDDDLFAVGLDSLSVLELGAALADAGYGDFDPPRLFEARTVAGICAQVDGAVDPGPSTAVVLNGGGTRPPLFAIPGGGGTALTFRFLAEALGADRPVVVIEPRGLHRPGPPDRTIATMAAHAREEIEARLGPGDPVLLLGYSAGGPVAYEAVGRMHAAGRRVRLVLLDTAPTRGGPQPSDERRRNGVGDPQPVRVREAAPQELPGAIARSLRFRWDHLRVRWIARWPGGPSYDEVRYRAFMHILGTAWGEYEPAPASFPTTLIHTPDDERERVCRSLVPDLSVHVVGGDHLTMLEPPEVARLAAVIGEVADGAFADLSAC